MVLAIFHLHINLLLHCKFQSNFLVVCKKMSATDFQDGGLGGHLGFPIDIILAHFDPDVVMLLEQVSAQIDQRFGKRCRKLTFNMAAAVAILHFRSVQFYLFCVYYVPRSSSSNFNSTGS